MNENLTSKHFDFIPFGSRALVFEFACDKCDCEIESDEIDIPISDLSAETARDSFNCDSEIVICNECGKKFEICVEASYVGGVGRIYNLPEEYEISIKHIPTPTYGEEPEYVIPSGT